MLLMQPQPSQPLPIVVPVKKRMVAGAVLRGLKTALHSFEPRYFVRIDLGRTSWRELRRIRIATCPYTGCSTYTSVCFVNVDGTLGEPVAGWPGHSWECPATPWWDIQPWVWFTTSFLTASPGSNQTYTSDVTWNNANNSIELIAGGASGAASAAGSSRCDTGGGAAAYSKITNFTFAVPGTTTATYQIGDGGAAQSGAAIDNDGADGGDSYFNGATYGASSLGAKGGVKGVVGLGATNGGLGGSSASGIGTTKLSGGRGGNANNTPQGTGGGGSAGPFQNGGAGVDQTFTGASDGGTSATQAGGTSGNPANPGLNGTDWDASHGAGSGGGGSQSLPANATAGDGGNYGGAGGGAQANSGTVTSGAGKQGLVVITWVVASSGGRGALLSGNRSMIIGGGFVI